MRKSNLSLYSVLLLSPQLTSAPEVDKDGRLRLAGYVPSRPQQVKFDLVFEQAGGQWKLLNIDISTTLEQPKSPDQQQSEPQRQPQPAQSRKLADVRTQAAIGKTGICTKIECTKILVGTECRTRFHEGRPALGGDRPNFHFANQDRNGLFSPRAWHDRWANGMSEPTLPGSLKS